MSTHAAIITKTEKGYKGIYVHFDGYPEHTGKILLEHYNTPEKVNELIDLGNLSYLEKRVKPNLDESHSYEKPITDVTIAYIRDKGEYDDDEYPIETNTIEDITDNFSYVEYVYIFDGNEWFESDEKLKDVLDKLNEETN